MDYLKINKSNPDINIIKKAAKVINELCDRIEELEKILDEKNN